MEKQNLRVSVSEFIALTNQTLEFAYPTIEIEGEVSSFKVNQGKFVFFDLKDESGTVGCFMMLFQLRVPIEDGMKVIITASPRLTQWGKFSLTVRLVRPSGEGALKKSFELLKKKLLDEGLFTADRKRPLPELPTRIAVISSTQAAGYADFIKILNERWGGLEVEVAHVQVQGDLAADQIVRALTYFNQQEVLPEVIVLTRGGGSADDLRVFNDEVLVRAVAGSRVPVLTGIGHEIDESLADLAADVAASTPSNAAQMLVPDRREIIERAHYLVKAAASMISEQLSVLRHERDEAVSRMTRRYEETILALRSEARALLRLVEQFNPKTTLAKGYALVRGDREVGSIIEIEEAKQVLRAEVIHVKTK